MGNSLSYHSSWSLQTHNNNSFFKTGENDHLGHKCSPHQPQWRIPLLGDYALSLKVIIIFLMYFSSRRARNRRQNFDRAIVRWLSEVKRPSLHNWAMKQKTDMLLNIWQHCDGYSKQQDPEPPSRKKFQN